MIYFLRHGLDDENYIGGWSDVDLLPEGVKQVEETLDKMLASGIKIHKVIASDVRRARTTADLAILKFGLDSYETSSVFKEQSKGLLNGMPKEEAEIKYPEYMSGVQVDTVYPDGESLQDLYNRIKDVLDYITSLDDDTLVVTHRGVINMLYYILNDIPLDMDKKRFGVTHGSVHGLNKKELSIRKVM